MRDKVDHHIKNACPCCMYELEGEMKLVYCLLFCMDGNDSLKQILWRNADDGSRKVASKERPDDWDSSGDYFLSCKRVDHWMKELIGQKMLQVQASPYFDELGAQY